MKTSEDDQLLIRKMYAKAFESLVESFPLVATIICVCLVAVISAYFAWDYGRYSAEKRIEEVKAAASSGLVEQPVWGKGSVWVKPEQYEPRKISD